MTTIKKIGSREIRLIADVMADLHLAIGDQNAQVILIKLYTQSFERGYAEGRAAGEHAELERIRHLAITRAAECCVACPDSGHCRRGCPHERPFADLLGGPDD